MSSLSRGREERLDVRLPLASFGGSGPGPGGTRAVSRRPFLFPRGLRRGSPPRRERRQHADVPSGMTSRRGGREDSVGTRVDVFGAFAIPRCLSWRDRSGNLSVQEQVPPLVHRVFVRLERVLRVRGGGRIRADRIRRFLGKRTLLPAAPSPRLWRLRANPRRETKEKGLKKTRRRCPDDFRRTRAPPPAPDRACSLWARTGTPTSGAGAGAPHRRRPTIGRTPRGARTRRPPRRATCRGRWTRRMTRGARKPSARTRGGARGPWRAPPRCARPGTARWSGSTCHAGGTLRTSPRGRARERTEASPRTRR